MELDEPRQRLIELVADRDTDLATVSRKINKNHAYLQQFVKRNSPRDLPEAVREALGAYFQVNPDIFRRTPQYHAPTRIETPELTEATYLTVGSAEFVAVPLFDARLSAGVGCINDPNAGPLGYHLIETSWLRMLTQAMPSSLAVVQVDGDSMERTLFDRDWVLIDRTQVNAERSGIYALQVGEATWVKRLELNLRAKLVSILSDNKEYPLQELPPDDLDIIGRVIWVVGRRL